MGKKNYLGNLFILLFLTGMFCTAMYHFLPDEVLGFRLKKVDLLSDIRIKEESVLLDSLRRAVAKPDSMGGDSFPLLRRDSALCTTPLDSVAVRLRDSLYRVMEISRNSLDSAIVRIEDFSPGHTGLKHFFDALNRQSTLNRPVRIAVLGDSFIEGDIVVADLREALQQRFGGHGVGFVPLASQVAQFRPTIEHRFSGWNARSLTSHRKYRYALPCQLFEVAGEKASARYKMATRYSRLQPVSRISLIYEENRQTAMRLICNTTDTLTEELPETHAIGLYTIEGCFNEADFSFTNAKGFRALGVAFEDSTGVVVDNFSLRGNSGMPLKGLDATRCEELNKVRPYDLIVLQYGLNVAVEGVLQYGWYRQQMVEVITYLKTCFPQTDILLLGVSDRSRQENGKFATMPAVLALLHTQRQLAQQTEIAFWNTFSAMGGENSMVRYVNKNWASKDYTHLSFRGGKEIASSLVKALLMEKQFYDEADKTTW